MPFEIVRNDITHMQVDAIVNTANPKVRIDHRADAKASAPGLPKVEKTVEIFGGSRYNRRKKTAWEKEYGQHH